MKKGFLLATVALFIVFSFHVIAEEVILSSSLNGSQYFQDDNDSGVRTSGDASVTIQGDSVSLFSRKGAENTASVKFYLTVGKGTEAVRFYSDGSGDCYIVIVDQEKTKGLSENEAINGSMLPFSDSDSRTLLIKDFPGILIDCGEYYMIEIHIVVANGNKYESRKVAVDSLVGDDIVVPSTIRRSAPIQRSIVNVLYNGPIITYDNQYCFVNDDWYRRDNYSYWAWRSAYYRTIIVPYYPVYVQTYYCPPTVVYIDRVVRHTHDHIVIINNVEQLRERRHRPETRFRGGDADSGNAGHGYAGNPTGKKGNGKGYKVQSGETVYFSRQDQVKKNIESQKALQLSSDSRKSEAKNSSEVKKDIATNPGFFTKLGNGAKQIRTSAEKGARRAGGAAYNTVKDTIIVGTQHGSYGNGNPAPSSGGSGNIQKTKTMPQQRERQNTSSLSSSEVKRTQPVSQQPQQQQARQALARVETPRQAVKQESSSTTKKDDDEDKDKKPASSGKRIRGR